MWKVAKNKSVRRVIKKIFAFRSRMKFHLRVGGRSFMKKINVCDMQSERRFSLCELLQIHCQSIIRNHFRIPLTFIVDCMLNRTSLFFWWLQKKTVKQFREIISDFHHHQQPVCCRCIHAAAFFSNKSLLRNRIVRNNRIVVVRLNGPADEKNDEENDG